MLRIVVLAVSFLCLAAVDAQASLLRANRRMEERLVSPPAVGGLLRVRSVKLERAERAERGRLLLEIDAHGEQPRDIADLEVELDRLATQAAAALPRRFRDADLAMTVDGQPLDRWLAASDLDSPGASTFASPPVSGPQLGVQGRRIAVSAGHGWYLNAGAWTLQRSWFYGIVEDFVNAELAMLLQSRLLASGALVTPLRQMSKTAGNGISGKPKWQEAARYHLRAIGAPSSIWNEAGYGTLSQDIRCRPRYANHVGADLLVSIHNNGGLGTGTEVWFDNANGWQGPSKRLADAIRTSVVSAIRTTKYPAWTDRGTKSCNGCKGENRLATRPAVIVELAFMDRRTPDNAALQDPAFRAVVAEAIARGVRNYYAAE